MTSLAFEWASTMMLAVSCPTHDSIISIFIDLDHEDIHAIDDNADGWTMLNTTIRSLQRRTHFLFGFYDRARMLRFEADIVNDRLPSLSTRGEVQYTVAKMEKRQGDVIKARYWYQASLQSEELQGPSVLYCHLIPVLTYQR